LDVFEVVDRVLSCPFHGFRRCLIDPILQSPDNQSTAEEEEEEEVIATAFQAMATQQAEYQTRLEETRTKIKVGIEARDRCDVIDGETFLAELQQKIEQRKTQSDSRLSPTQ
jgi:hypothetical protein